MGQVKTKIHRGVYYFIEEAETWGGHLFIQLTCVKHLLFYCLDSVLGAGDTTVNQTVLMEQVGHRL